MRVRFRAFVAAAALLLPVATPLVFSTAASAATECGCPATGDYKAPATVAPNPGEVSGQIATSPGGAYKLETSQSGSRVTLTVKRTANNSVAASFDNIPVARVSWGWSPDGNRFLVQHAFPGSEQTTDQITIWDLATNTSRLSQSVTAGAVAGFSPHGAYFFVSSITQANFAHMYVYNAATGANVAGYDYTLNAPPGGTDQTFGVSGYGFSPDDRSFLLSYLTSGNQVQVSVRNLETKQNVVNQTTSGGAYWRFSPCGEAFGLVTQQSGSQQISIRLFGTQTGVGMASQQLTLPGSFKLTATATKHQFAYVTSGSGAQTLDLANNTAATACPTGPALSALTFNATDLTGAGKTSTGTIRITSAPTATMTVALSSSDPSALTVPTSVTVASGATTKTFTATSKAVTSAKVVTVTATVNGVSKTSTVTVNPASSTTPKVAGLAVADNPVTAGGATTATIELDLAAPTGGTAIALTSSAPSVAIVPATTTVTTGERTKTFAIQTSSVPVDTQVTITATAGGQAISATFTVRSAAISVSPNAVIDDEACLGGSIAANDDGSSPAIGLPNRVNFFGSRYGLVYVNNNGNVTFNSPQDTYTPYTINASTPPIIAPFFADVDTRGAGSKLVTYSTADRPATFGGRPAFCANWVDVGYYNSHTDKLNSFQLLLVDRSDVAEGDFDIVFNYDRIQWETGDASDGSSGYGGSSAGAGYSAGTGDSTQFFQVPGTLLPGALLDSNADSGLTRTSRGTLQRGRQIFEVRNGAAPTGGTIAGDVTDSSGHPQPGAPVWICATGGSTCAATMLTGPTGSYRASGIPAGDYTVRANPPTGSTASSSWVRATLEAGDTEIVNLVLHRPRGLPEGTTLSPSTTNGMGIPTVFWGAPLDLDTAGCVGATARYAIAVDGAVVSSGDMFEGEDGRYTAQVPPLSPVLGMGVVTVTFECPDATVETVEFDIYIDPSGFVLDQNGDPVVGATVTLLRADSAAGPFVEVPDGSAVMSPSNRNNPDLTDADGHFGWDVIAGYYKVRATKTGCTTVETAALPVPPEVTDLELRLDCSGAGTGPTDGGSPQPTPQPSPPADGSKTDETATDTDTGGIKVKPTLPYTGSQTAGALALAFGLLVAGGLLWRLGRRAAD